jgi:type II secretory pathway component PulF
MPDELRESPNAPLKAALVWALIHATLLAGIALVVLVYVPRQKVVLDDFIGDLSDSTLMVLDLPTQVADHRWAVLTAILVFLAVDVTVLYALERRPQTKPFTWLVAALFAALLFAGLCLVVMVINSPFRDSNTLGR